MKKRISIISLVVVGLAFFGYRSFGTNVIISPNMNLPVPIVNQAPGPEWANDINSCMGAIDSHDHTPGHGVPISSQAININADLPLNGNSLTSAEAVVFSSQASFATNQSLYVESPDLFYNDGNGNIVRITQGGAVSGASGTITGLPSGTASASYQSVGGTFVFQSATNTPVNISGATVQIAEQTASITPNGINLKAPSGLAASYNVTYPSSVPSFTSLLTMSTSGNLATVPYHIPTIQKFTSGSGTYSLPTNPTPLYIQVEMVGGGGGGGGRASGSGVAGGNTTFGTALLVANGGAGGSVAPGQGGAGGTASLGAASGIAVSGGGGGAGTGNTSVAVQVGGGTGGSSALGGGGLGGYVSTNGGDGVTNSGGGGGGAGGDSSTASAGGGGAGGYVKAIITSLSATYSYAVGSGGTPGGGTTNGGNGAAGQIVVTEIYQ